MTIERVLTWALAIVVVVAPLLIGSVHPLTQASLSLAVWLLVALYMFGVKERKPLHTEMFSQALLFGCAVTLIQLVPWPSLLVRILSPHTYRLYADVSGDSHPFMTFTVDRSATLLALLRSLTCAGVLFLSRSLAQSARRVKIMLSMVAAVGVVVALLTILERATQASKILWFYKPLSMPGSGFWGTFVNGNHAASLFALACLVAMGLAIELDGWRRGLATASALLCMSMTLYTGSRAGSLGLGAALFFLCLTSLVRRAGMKIGIPLTIAVLLVGVGAMYFSADLLRSRIEQAAKGPALFDNQKTRGWGAGMRLAADYPVIGVGRGAFEAPAGPYREGTENVRLVYPENLVVQRVSEWGYPASLTVLGLVIYALWSHRRRFKYLDSLSVAAGLGVAAVFLHEMADFGLEFLGVALPVFLVLGVVLARLEERGALSMRKVSTPLAATVAGVWLVLLLASPWAVAHTLYRDFLHAKSATNRADIIATALKRHPASDELMLLGAHDFFRDQNYPEAMKVLNRTLLRNPQNGQAHYFVAHLLVATGHPAQAAIEYRLAQEADFPVPSEELFKTVRGFLGDALPQEPSRLLWAMGQLLSAKETKLAVRTAERAIEASNDSVSIIRDVAGRLQMLHDKEEMIGFADRLLRLKREPEVYVAVAEALDKNGAQEEALSTLTAAREEYPQSTPVLMALAQEDLNAGQTEAARDLLRRVPSGASLEERAQAEDLLAQMAEKAGDTESAIVARTRARMLRKKSAASELP